MKEYNICGMQQMGVGVIDIVDPENTLKWYRQIHAAFEKYGISRCAWSYKQMDFGLSDPRMDGVRQELIRLLQGFSWLLILPRNPYPWRLAVRNPGMPSAHRKQRTRIPPCDPLHQS